jgi:hypothetical protein
MKMEYTVNGIITLSPGSEIRLSSKVDFILPSKANIIIESKSDNQLSVQIKLEADNDITAQELARLELAKIGDLMSFYRKISITKCGITGMSYTKTNLQGNTEVAVMAIVGLHAAVSCMLTLSNNSLKILTSQLKQDISVDCSDVISLWREAFSRESPVERFFSLYRLMEQLFGKAKSIDDWIKHHDPSVQLYPKNDYRDYEHTIYTYLRDNIHYKKENRLFPIKEIQDNLDKFQTLVHQAIEEKFGI